MPHGVNVWSQTQDFLAAEQMSRADELAQIEECVGDIARAGRLSPDALNLACLLARFVHLVAEKEAQEDAAIWDATIGDPDG